MKISIELKDRDFAVHLHTREGEEAFLSIFGCRIVDGSKGRFVSWPARKSESGKWWNHCRSSDKFTAAVLAAYDAAAPVERPAPRPRTQVKQADDDDIPF
jgi:hypothetical protein